MVLIDHAAGAAVASASAALWVRRTTLRYRWERAGTINLAGLLACLVFMHPRLAQIYEPLRRVTGVWNLEDLAGHLCYLAGITVLAHAMISRVDIPDLQRWLRQHMELPANIAPPTLVCLFISGAPDHHVADLLVEPCSGPMTAYWVVLCASAAWSLGHLLWALLIVRTDPASATVANLYVAAVVVDIAADASCVAGTFIPWWGQTVTWALISAAVVLFAAAAIYGMRSVRSWLQLGPQRPHPTQPAA